MARKHLNGQLNIFDLLNNWEGPAMGEEVEMVSLMPELEEEIEPAVVPEENQEPQIVQEESSKPTESKTRVPKTRATKVQAQAPQSWETQIPEPQVLTSQAPEMKRKPTNFNEKVIMHRKFQAKDKEIDIAYLSYNKVRIRTTGEEDRIMEFVSSKEAVDYYVDRIQALDDSGEDK
ncbi:MAG: hypothetical protein J6R94_05675 [Agathobacter sp.]|nr:hypothetical protein [Agathobacter sp.]